MARPPGGPNATSRKASPAKPRRSSRPNPFGSLSDHHNNACVNNYMQFEELAEHYRDSGDALVKCTAEDTSTLDVHVYAICFLYRHSFELLLKALFWQSGYALSGDKSFWKSHGLGTLWGEVEKRGRKLLGSDYPLMPKESAAVRQLFADIEEHDPQSDAFRYPVSTSKQRTHPSLTNVNLRALRDSVHEVSELLGRIIHMVGYHYSQRSEAENG